MQGREFNTEKYLFIAIMVVAAMLRVYEINQPFIDAVSWRQTDTATIADNFYHGNWNIFYPEISWNGPEHNYVGYEFQTITYVSALLYRIFGHHDWIGRSVAIIFGLWGTFAFYQLVRRVWGAKHAIVSAAVLAILPGQIYVDRSFLPDPVMLSLVITSVWMLVAYLQTGSLRYLLLASLAGMFGFLTKISGFIVAVPMLYVILSILKQKQKLYSKQLLLIIIAGIIILIPVISYYMWAIHISQTLPPYYIAAGEYWVWKYGLNHFLEQNYFLRQLYSQLNWFWTKPIIALVIAGLFFMLPWFRNNAKYSQLSKGTRRIAPWIFHWWIFAFIVYYLVAAQGLVKNPTNLNIVNPAAAALTASALITIASFAQRFIRLRISSALVAIMLLIIAGYEYTILRSAWFQPWAINNYRLGLALRKISQPNDLVVTGTGGDTVALYYSQRRGWVFPPVYAWVTFYAMDDYEAIQLLEELSAKGADWFGILNEQRDQLLKDKPKLIEYLESKFERSYESTGFAIYNITSKK